MKNFFCAENSVIETNVSLGDGTKIWYFSHIRRGAKIGSDCIVGDYVFIDSDVIVGDDVKIANNVSLYAGTIIRNRVFIGNGTVITNVRNPIAKRKGRRLDTIVDDDASIGANATIVAGVKIGRMATVGEGAIVLHDVPDMTFVAGKVAHIKKEYKVHDQ